VCVCVCVCVCVLCCVLWILVVRIKERKNKERIFINYKQGTQERKTY